MIVSNNKRPYIRTCIWSELKNVFQLTRLEYLTTVHEHRNTSFSTVANRKITEKIWNAIRNDCLCLQKFEFIYFCTLKVEKIFKMSRKYSYKILKVIYIMGLSSIVSCSVRRVFLIIQLHSLEYKSWAKKQNTFSV